MHRRSGLAVLGMLSWCLAPPLSLAVQSDAAEESPRQEAPENSSTSEPILFLEGVVVASQPERSVALVRRPGGGYARAVTVGETIYGYELLQVSSEGITVREGTGVFRVTLSGEWMRETPRSVNGSPTEEKVESPASRRTELERSLVEKRLSAEMPRILAQTGLTPRVLEGRIQGFRITRLPGGTVLDDAGIRAGDVLMSINGISLNSPYTLIGLYPRLQAEDEIRVVLERAGHTVTYVYNFN